MTHALRSDALVIGAGPAGLMAADALASSGRAVTLVDAMPSVGRKFLMAGKSGLNLTKSEDQERFIAQYGPAPLREMIAAFGPQQTQDWAEALGQPLFTGSTGRVFPKAMKASPLLRAWLMRLDGLGVTRQTRWRWQGWDGDACLFDTPDGPAQITPKVTVLALGGASWARLGSDGRWADHIPVTPFAPANSGLHVDWSSHMTSHLGQPVKGVCWHAGDQISRGEAMLSQRGLEGGGIYPLTPALRCGADLHVDLLPDLDLAEITRRLSRPRGKETLANHLRKTLKLDRLRLALLNECARPLPQDPGALATCIKTLKIPHQGPRPMDEAISTAGGVPFAALDETLMLRARPGTFCAGEMLDWEAPTGGYLITACLATGLWAGRHAARWP